MSTYVIGDIHGCYESLQALLIHIAFDPQQDCLWFTGDLVNRGPRSLEVLRFIKNLPNAIVVLGNHDIYLLALANNYAFKNHTLQAVLAAPDKAILINWLRQQPVLHYDPTFNCVMVHAGLLAQWTLRQAQLYASEISAILKKPAYATYLHDLYGDDPAQWDKNLSGWPRLRCLLNVFTRLRFCTAAGKLDFIAKGEIGTQAKGYFPWFEIPNHSIKNTAILFGHWSALSRKVAVWPNVFALDTGCVWGGYLTALRLEDRQHFSVPAKEKASLNP